MKNIQRLYLANWPYNAALILDELENMVISKGGKIVSTWKKEGGKSYLISNRSLSAAVHKQETLVNALRERNRPALAEQEKELARLKAIFNEPVLSRNGNYLYITFSLNEIYYSFNMDSNPFFPFTFCKTPIIDGKINPDFYANSDEKEWLTDDLLSFSCSQESRKKAATNILEMLLAADFGKRFNGNRKNQTVYEVN